jgi:hypothetical protein
MFRSSFLAVVVFATVAVAEPVTYSKHIAPLIHTQCIVCHRPGEIGPFSLETYADAKKRATLIARVTGRRTMPVWKPEPGHGEFLDERRLSDREIGLFAAWAEQGAPEGNPAETPRLPAAKTGWKLGKPDIILKMPKPFRIPAEGRDIYVHFVFPLKIDKEIYVRGVECRPGNPKVAHHAVGLLDGSGTARKLDAKDPEPGYVNFGGPGFIPGGFTPGYVPGQTPRFFDEGAALTIRKGTDFVLQMHYHPSGKEESDQTEIGLYLTKTPPTRHMLGVLMANEEIDIPAGSDSFRVTDEFKLPVAMKVGSLWAHMHLIGKEIEAWAETPDGRRINLLKIGDWDFNWQDTYVFRKPIPLPKGTVLKTRWAFDNTEKNPRNPNVPPKRVTLGEGSADEMTGLWIGGEVDNGWDLLSLLGANIGHYFDVKKKGEEFFKGRSK